MISVTKTDGGAEHLSSPSGNEGYDSKTTSARFPRPYILRQTSPSLSRSRRVAGETGSGKNIQFSRACWKLILVLAPLSHSIALSKVFTALSKCPAGRQTSESIAKFLEAIEVRDSPSAAKSTRLRDAVFPAYQQRADARTSLRACVCIPLPQPVQLTKAEKLQLFNLRPSSAVRSPHLVVAVFF